jgi:Zn-dependent metalloprotease
MKHLTTLISFILTFSIYGECQIQNFYNYLESNLKSYDLAGFYFVKTPNNIPPEGFFDVYKLQSGDVDNDVILIKTWEDPQLHMTHYKYQQTYKGILVEVAEITEHFIETELDMVNGKLVGELNLNVDPQISSEEAISIVLNHYNIVPDSEFKNDLVTESNSIQIVQDPELLLAIDNYSELSAIIDGDRYSLTWKIQIQGVNSKLNKNVFINAINGSIYREDDLNMHGNADIWYHGNQFIDTEWQGGLFSKYYLEAYDNGRNIKTFYEKTDAVPWDKDDNWGTNHHDGTAPHWFAMKSWDYFKDVYSHNGYDNNGSQLDIKFAADGNNAWYSPNSNGDDYITLTNDQGQYYGRAIDVVGHEFTHGITRYNSNLHYSFEPGALNESFSDIFGTLIEAYAEGSLTDWTLGEDPNLSRQRSLSSPKTSGIHYNLNNGVYSESPGQPDTYSGQFWFNGTYATDYGGVHVNSGVQNHWFYLLAHGGNGVNDNNDTYNISNIPLNDAALIAYWNMTINLQTGSTFADARIGSIYAATLFYGSCSNQVIQTTNAWHAVGVGLPSTCSTTDVNTIENRLDLTIFPNPATDILNITTTLTTIQQINLVSMAGKIVFKVENINPHNKYQINMENISTGIYILEIKANDYTLRKRVIVNN